MSMQNVGIALTGDDRQLLQILQQMEGHLKSLNTVAQKAMGGTATAAEEAARAFRQVEQAAGGSATAVASAGRAMSTYTAMSRDARVEANLLRQANRQMAMQMTDVVTSLASGMPLWMVFIQQGGQIKDAYGGVGQALSGVARYLRTLINPVTAVIAVLGAVAAAAKIASNQFQDANKHVVLTGEAAGVTAGQMMVMANSITEVAGSRGQALEALKALSGAAGVGAEDMGRFALAAIQMARAGGPAIEETARKFVELGNKPLETLVKLNEKENFLTDSVYRAVRALQEQGRAAEAAKLAQQAYLAELANRTAQMESELDNLDRALKAVGKTARDVANWVLQIFGGSSLEERISEMQSLLNRLERDAPPKDSNPQFERLHKANMDRARKELKALEDQLAERNKLNKAEEESKNQGRALAAWDAKQVDYLGEQAKHAAKIAQIRKDAAAAGAANDPRVRAEMERRIRVETERFEQSQAGARQKKTADAMALFERLDQQNYVLKQQIALGRELTEGEKLRIQLVDDIRTGRLSINDKTFEAIENALREGDALRATWQAEQDRKKQKEADDAAAKKYDQERQAAQAQRIADLREELEQQGLNTQALDDQILSFMRGKEALEAERDARELRRATMLEERAAAMEVFGLQTAEIDLLRRLAAGIVQQVEARKRLRDEQTYQESKTDIDRARQSADELVASIKDETAALRMSSEEREISNALLQLERTGLEKGTAAYDEYAAKIRSAIVDRNTVRDSNQASERIAAEWDRMTDQVGQSLADALINGGQSAGESIKRYFSTLILQPIIRAIVDPVARAIVSGLGLAGAAGSAAADAGASAAGSAAGSMGLLASGTSIIGAGAAATMGGNLMGAMGSAGAMLSGGATLQGLAMGAGAAAPIVAAVMLGRQLYKSISSGYSVNGGSFLAKALGFATGGLANRAFGRRLEDTGIQGTFGGPAGFTGQQFSFEKGGWFRSDRTRTSALGADTQSLLSSSFARLRDDTVKMARDLGLASASVATFSRDVKISLKGLTQEQIAERLQKELGLVADEMARLVGGADATADSLRTLYQAVMQERAQLEQRLLQLQGDTAELRRRERDALHESNRALYDRIISLQDERAAMDAMVGSAVSAVQKQISASQAAANAARAAAQAYAAAGTSLRQTIAALLGGSAPGASAATAYRTGLTAAQGGDAAAMGNLGNLATAYAESLRGTARTRAEANIGSARIAAELASVAALSDTLGTQRSVQAGLLDINTAALQVLQEDLQNGNLTVELLREHSTNLQAIATALSANGVVVGQLQSNDQTTGAVASSTDGVIEEQTRAASILANSDLTLTRVLARLSEADPSSLLLIDRITSGNTLLADRLSGVINAIKGQTLAQQAEVKRQQDLLKAQADLESAAGYLANLQSTARAAQATFADTSQTEQVRVGNKGWYKGGGGIYETRANPAYNIALAEVARANEALAAFEPSVTSLRDLVTSLGGVPAFAVGGMHSGGVRLVGERGPELEVTGPARYWSAADTTAMLGNSQRREELLAAEIRALRAELQGLRAEARVTAVAANKSQRLWERVTRDGESMQITDVTPTP